MAIKITVASVVVTVEIRVAGGGVGEHRHRGLAALIGEHLRTVESISVVPVCVGS